MQNTSVQLQTSQTENSEELTSSHSVPLVKILARLENEKDLKEVKVALLEKQSGSSTTYDQVYLSGKMLKEHSPATIVKTFGQYSKSLPTLGGGEYQIEWQLLNTKWFLPQNRERIYLVGHLTERSESGVFPIGEAHSNSNIREEKKFRDYSRTLTARYFASGTTGSFLKVKQGIRRFTEIECERLQGLPDDWTKYGNFDGVVKEISKTQRYKMIGNAVTVNVVEAIARKLKLKI